MSIAQATVRTAYSYDPIDRLASCTAQGQAAIQYFYMSDRLASVVQSQRQQRLFQTDSLLLGLEMIEDGAARNALLATDKASSVLHSLEGPPHQPYVYTPYGVRHPQSGPTGMPGFTGQQPDPTTGHYLLGNGARAFNPVLKRFNSADTFSPFGKGGMNVYAYCSGDPVNNTDPSGHFISKLLEVVTTIRYALRTELTVAWSPQQSNILRTTLQSVSRNPNPIAPMPPARQMLQDAIAPLSRENPFIVKLDEVNLNLASHGHGGLSMSHARNYAGLAKRVDAGELSNTGAHVMAAEKWAETFGRQRRPSAVVGVVLNYAGAFASGPRDHLLHKTGKALRMTSPRLP